MALPAIQRSRLRGGGSGGSSSHSHPRDAWQLEPQDMGPAGPGRTPEGRLRKARPYVQAFNLQVPVSGRLHVMPIVKKRYMKLTSWVRGFEFTCLFTKTCPTLVSSISLLY